MAERRGHRERRASGPDLDLVGYEDDDAQLTQFERGLAVDVRSARELLAGQSEKYYCAALREARLRSEYERAARQVELTHDRVADFIREAARRRGEALTDAAVASRAAAHAEVEAARVEAAGARRRLLLAEALVRAYEMRHAALLALVASSRS